MAELTIPTPDYADPKEVYAFFGLAFYSAQVLEQKAVNLAVALRWRGRQQITFRDVQEMYDAVDKETFGRVLKGARHLTSIPAELETDREPLWKRKLLGARFFVVHSLDLLNDTGRRQMIDELRSIMELVIRVDRQLDELWIDAWDRLG